MNHDLPIFISLTDLIITLLELVSIQPQKNNKSAQLIRKNANKKKGILASLISQLCLKQSHMQLRISVHVFYSCISWLHTYFTRI